MGVWHIVGVDPGLVHTGVVCLTIGDGEVIHEHALIKGLDAVATAKWIRDHAPIPYKIFIEKYDPRMNFSSDERMVKGEAHFMREMRNAKLITNLGVTKVVPMTVLDVLGLWSFPTPSHHQDLRSAARIALLGMMKDPFMNITLADCMKAALDGAPWPVANLGGGVLVASVTD